MITNEERLNLEARIADLENLVTVENQKQQQVESELAKFYAAANPDTALKLVRTVEVYGAERDHARACYDRAVRILTGIHALLYPPRFTNNDERTWQFKSPLAEEQMQELSDRIRALPDEIAAIEAEAGKFTVGKRRLKT